MEGEEDPSLGDVLDGVAEAVITNKVSTQKLWNSVAMIFFANSGVITKWGAADTGGWCATLPSIQVLSF